MPRKRSGDKHIQITPNGFRAQIRIDGQLHRQRFKKDTEIVTIKKWLLAVEMKYRGKAARRTGRFRDDARVYLESVKAMPTYTERAKHIEEWIAEFGDRERDSISSDEIRAVLHRWRTEPREVTYTRRATTKDPKTGKITLSASSVNNRRTALMYLYTVLDGKAAPNPVRDVPKFREPDPLPKGIPYPILRKLFQQMRDTPTKARLMVLAYAGIPHKQLMAIQAQDVDLAGRTVRVHGREKGAGTGARIVPLTDDGVRAFKAMARNDAWGHFARSSVHRDFRAACRRVPELVASADQLTPYDLRHSFGTELYRSSGDIRATQILMDHSSPTLTHRYTLAAVDPRVAAAVLGFGRRNDPAPDPVSPKGQKKRQKEPAF